MSATDAFFFARLRVRRTINIQRFFVLRGHFFGKYTNALPDNNTPRSQHVIQWILSIIKLDRIEQHFICLT